MWKFSHWIFSLVAAGQRVIERRFTGAGLLVVGVLVATAALGADTGQTVAYRIFSFAAALLLVAFAGTLLQRNRFAVTRNLPRVATVGEPFQYRVTVSNLQGAARDGLTLIDDLADPRPALAAFRAQLKWPTYRAWKRLIQNNKILDVGSMAIPPLQANAAAQITLAGTALRRGNQHFSGVTVARADPLNLMRGLSLHAAPANLLVLPQRYAMPPITLPGSRRHQPGGVALAASVGDSEEFIGLRDYRPGDPLQRIHWKSYARTGEPVVREHQDEYFERHALILDTFGDSAKAAAFEDAVSVAASLAYTVNTQECLLDLMFAGTAPYCYTAGRGQLSTGSLMEVLAGVPLSDASFEVLRSTVIARRGLLTGSICVLLDWDEARRSFVRELQMLGVPVLVLLVSANVPAERPAWLRVIEPGKVQQGLARL